MLCDIYLSHGIKTYLKANQVKIFFRIYSAVFKRHYRKTSRRLDKDMVEACS